MVLMIFVAACQPTTETLPASSSDVETVASDSANVLPGEIYEKEGYKHLPYNGYIIEESSSEERYVDSTYSTSFSKVYIIEGYAKQSQKGEDSKYIVYPTAIHVYNFGREWKEAVTSEGEIYRPYEVIYHGSFSHSFEDYANAGIGSLFFDNKGTATNADDETSYAFTIASFEELYYGSKETIEKVFDEERNTTATTVEIGKYTMAPFINIGQGFHPELCSGVYYSDTKLSKPSDCLFVVDNSQTAPYFVSYYMYDEIRPSETEIVDVVYDWDLGPYSSPAEAIENMDISESPLKDDKEFMAWLKDIKR